MDFETWKRKVAKNPSSVTRASLDSERQDDINDAEERRLLLSIKQNAHLIFSSD